MSFKSNSRGFSHIEMIALGAVIACLVAVGAYVANRNHTSSALISDTAGTAGTTLAPSDLQTIATSPLGIELSWTGSSNENATYQIERNGTVIGTTTDTAYTDTNVTPGVEYTYVVDSVLGALVYPSTALQANTFSADFSLASLTDDDSAPANTSADPNLSSATSDTVNQNGTEYKYCPTIVFKNSCTLDFRDSHGFAGYNADNRIGAFDKFTAVTAEIRMPDIKCTQRGDAAAFLVGINGFNNPATDKPITVQYAGVIAFCDTNGKKGTVVKYLPTVDMFPASTPSVGPDLTIKKDQLIKLSIVYTGDGYYHFSIVNLSTNTPAQNLEFKCNPGDVCLQRSAEWLVAQLQKHPILNFGTVLFKDAYAIEKGDKLPAGDFINDARYLISKTKSLLIKDSYPLVKGGDQFRSTFY